MTTKGRPATGGRAPNISVRFDPQSLRELDLIAQEQKISRSALLNRWLPVIVAKEKGINEQQATLSATLSSLSRQIL
jgi:metal-responsive CopG/Arc/MetJ family transcriptional regulator